MAFDAFQQFVQTQQVQTDNSAVKAIDAAVASMGLREHVDAIGNGLVEHIGNMLGAGVNKLAEKGSGTVSRGVNRLDAMADRVSAQPTPSQGIAKASSTPDRSPSLNLAPEAAMKAHMAVASMMNVGVPNNFNFNMQDMSGHNHNFAAQSTPIGISAGHAQGMSM